MNFHARLRENDRWRKATIICGLIASAALFSGYDGPQELVEETYTVQAGDTVWSIAESYLPKNTGGRRDVREFKSCIEQLNPDVYADQDRIYPGQKLNIAYFVVKGDDEE